MTTLCQFLTYTVSFGPQVFALFLFIFVVVVIHLFFLTAMLFLSLYYIHLLIFVLFYRMYDIHCNFEDITVTHGNFVDSCRTYTNVNICRHGYFVDTCRTYTNVNICRHGYFVDTCRTYNYYYIDTWEFRRFMLDIHKCQ